MAGLPLLEFRFRRAQAFDALDEIRRLRRLYSGLIMKKRSHISSSQRTMSRSRSLFTGYNLKIQHAAARYRNARIALGRLDPSERFMPWKAELQELRKEDVRGPGRESYERSGSHHTPSWIWLTCSSPTSIEADSQDLHNSLQVEWCRTQARAERLEEEVELLVCEMQRVLEFFEWKVGDWEQRANSRVEHDPSLNENVAAGVSAYARRQAGLYRQLVNAYICDWYESLELKSLASSWLPKYTRPPTLRRRRRLISNVRLYHSVCTSSSDDEGRSSPIPEGDCNTVPEDGVLDGIHEWAAES